MRCAKRSLRKSYSTSLDIPIRIQRTQNPNRDLHTPTAMSSPATLSSLRPRPPCAKSSMPALIMRGTSTPTCEATRQRKPAT